MHLPKKNCLQHHLAVKFRERSYLENSTRNTKKVHYNAFSIIDFEIPAVMMEGWLHKLFVIPQVTLTIPSDLLLECVSNVLRDARHRVREGTVVLEPYIPKVTQRPLENWTVRPSVMTSIVQVALFIVHISRKTCLLHPNDYVNELQRAHCIQASGSLVPNSWPTFLSSDATEEPPCRTAECIRRSEAFIRDVGAWLEHCAFDHPRLHHSEGPRILSARLSVNSWIIVTALRGTLPRIGKETQSEANPHRQATTRLLTSISRTVFKRTLP
ncbi:hypothetical protein TNCV_5119671 [Trichonephila clavipes]|nr:hypothetical protein TNCV_5119671 [Trichonephila clavipes]